MKRRRMQDEGKEEQPAAGQEENPKRSRPFPPAAAPQSSGSHPKSLVQERDEIYLKQSCLQVAAPTDVDACFQTLLEILSHRQDSDLVRLLRERLHSDMLLTRLCFFDRDLLRICTHQPDLSRRLYEYERRQRPVTEQLLEHIRTQPPSLTDLPQGSSSIINSSSLWYNGLSLSDPQDKRRAVTVLAVAPPLLPEAQTEKSGGGWRFDRGRGWVRAASPTNGDPALLRSAYVVRANHEWPLDSRQSILLLEWLADQILWCRGGGGSVGQERQPFLLAVWQPVEDACTRRVLVQLLALGWSLSLTPVQFF
jgi:hypothetical protein